VSRRGSDRGRAALLALDQPGVDIAQDGAEDHVQRQHPPEGAEAGRAGEGPVVADHGDEQHHGHPGADGEDDALGDGRGGRQSRIGYAEQRPQHDGAHHQVNGPSGGHVARHAEHLGHDSRKGIEQVIEEQIDELKHGNRDGSDEAGDDSLFYA
jgi:hypothetical protein